MSIEGGWAFPMIKEEGHATPIPYGMNLRDWFAGMVLQGIVADSSMRGEWGGEQMALYAYQVAEAMIVAKDKP